MVCHAISIFKFTRLLSRGNYSLSNGRFRISGGGGARFRILEGAKRGRDSQQAHGVILTSMRRNDVASTSF